MNIFFACLSKNRGLRPPRPHPGPQSYDIASHRTSPWLKAALWALIAGGFALPLSHTVSSEASLPAAGSEPYFFPAQFKAPEGEPAEPIATF
jgi:hypothetical protein